MNNRQFYFRQVRLNSWSLNSILIADNDVSLNVPINVIKYFLFVPASTLLPSLELPHPALAVSQLRSVLVMHVT